MLTYKNYSGVVEYDEAGKLFTGEIVGLRDVITFQGRTADELERSFRESIDFYLEMCEKDEVPPEKLYSGRFNVRLNPEMHRRIAQQAALRKVSLNQWVNEALEQALEQ